MNDFDFEELDKAVSDLATKTHDEHGGPDPTASPAPLIPGPVEPAKLAIQPEPAATHTPEPVQPAERPGADEPQPESIPVAQPQRHTPRLSETRPRSRGSFMDIVPPNRKPAPHVGVSIQPLSKPENVVPEKVEPELKDETPRSAETAKSVETPKSGGEVAWPDPLDFHGDEPAKKEEKPEEPEPAEPTSPFLAEAKVEKRPLGAFSNFRPKPVEKPSVDEPKPEPIKDELTPEQDGTFKEPESPQAPEKAPIAPRAETKEKEEPSKPDLHGTAMMSIPQQYHTEARAADKTMRPVFDTKEYHPPLIEAATGEHRGGGSMWGKLFIAFVVLVLLGVAGYFAYLYVMQR